MCWHLIFFMNNKILPKNYLEPQKVSLRRFLGSLISASIYLLSPSSSVLTHMEGRCMGIYQTSVKRCYIFSSMVEIILTLTGCKMLDQFTSLPLILFTYKMNIVTQPAYRVSFNQRALGTDCLHGIIHAITYLDFTADAPWFGVIHFKETK